MQKGHLRSAGHKEANEANSSDQDPTQQCTSEGFIPLDLSSLFVNLKVLSNVASTAMNKWWHFLPRLSQEARTQLTLSI